MACYTVRAGKSVKGRFRKKKNAQKRADALRCGGSKKVRISKSKSCSRKR